ncbi:helix-turn-helix transcriptional regulator [Paenibacillus tyrfis]|uniref:helix-turn-helix transcriptional regulator n=1 Tax=Paenibacillus tyrfis TaxID=1501230 RepID=UPI0020A0E068|nr:WYL domain-containing protein [Paenibacillus tyrfis]MCP1309891.1 WYL domain-containing protein [Paenibacillus tyrfis]
MRADRLLSILLLLQNRGRMTSRELAEQLEVSERTIFRDMEALSASGIPLYAERGSGGGWVLPEGYRSQLTGLKIDEIRSLLLAHASGMIRDLGWREAFEAALLKLLAALPPSLRRDAEAVRERIHVDGAGWYGPSEEVSCLSNVQEAVWEERLLAIRYGRGDEVVEREVGPLGLVVKGNAWYLIGLIDGQMRTYRVSRIRSAIIRPESFERPADFELARYWEQSTADFKSRLPSYLVTLQANTSALALLREEHFVKIRETRPAADGLTELTADFQTAEYALRIIPGHGGGLQVLEPEELRADLLRLAETIRQIYSH